jgi:hypothetical protein
VYAYLSIVWTGVAPAAPKVDARAKEVRAARLDARGEDEQALVAIEDGLALAPKDLKLLELRGRVLLKQREYAGALAAYQAYLDAGAKGANRRQAQTIVEKLGAVQSTFLAVTLDNGPADIYLDSKTQGVFCTAAPSCTQPVFAGQYKVIAERPGFKRWTGSITIENGQTTPLPITLVEQPSLLTVRVDQPGARVTVDDTAYDAPARVAAGTHQIAVSLAGYVKAQREIVAHEGKPVELDVPLTPLVAIHLEPPGAAHVEVKPTAVPQPRSSAVGGRFMTRRRVLLGVAGAGVISVAVGVVLGVIADKTTNEAFKLCRDPATPCTTSDQSNAFLESAHSRALAANIAFGIGAAAAVGAGVLWFTGAPDAENPRRVSVIPSAVPGETGVLVQGRF